MPKRNAAYMLEQREQITKAALRCFVSNGLHKTSMRDVCKEAGVSMGALYVHFQNKEQLLEATVMENLRSSDPLPDVDTWEAFEEFIRTRYADLSSEEYRAQSSLAFEMAADRLRNGEQAPHWAEIQDEHRGWYRRILEGAVRDGKATLPMGEDKTIDAIVAMFSGLAFHVSMDSDLEPSEAFEDMLPVLRRICGVDSTDQ